MRALRKCPWPILAITALVLVYGVHIIAVNRSIIHTDCSRLEADLQPNGQEVAHFASRISDITRRNEGVPQYFLYLDDPDYERLYTSATDHSDLALRALAGAGLSEEESVVLTFAMRGLSTGEFLDFSEEVLRLRHCGWVSSDLVLHLLMMPFTDRSPLDDWFWHPRAQALLRYFRSDPSLSAESRQGLTRMLWGDRWNPLYW